MDCMSSSFIGRYCSINYKDDKLGITVSFEMIIVMTINKNSQLSHQGEGLPLVSF